MGLKHFVGAMLFGLCLAVTPAIGQATAKETVLTEDNVGRFLASFGEMRNIAIGEGLKTGTDPQIARNPIGAVMKAIKSSKLNADAEKIAAAHGFADLNEWAATGGAIAQSYLFITGAPARGIARETLEKNKDAAISQLEKFGLLNANSKQKLKDTLDSATDALAKEPPPENVEVVKRLLPEIEAAVKIGG